MSDDDLWSNEFPMDKRERREEATASWARELAARSRAAFLALHGRDEREDDDE